MKRIKAINGYTIYQATTQRDADNYNCHVGSYNIYLTTDIRDFGLTNSYPEWEDEDSLAVAIARCNGSNYAVAVALADELSQSTVQDMDLCLELERRLDAGDSISNIIDCYDSETGRLYGSVSEAIAAGYEPFMDELSALDSDPYGALDDSAEGFDPDGLLDGDLEDVLDAALSTGDHADRLEEETPTAPAPERRSHASYAVLRDPDNGQYVTISAPCSEGLDTQEKRDDWLLTTVSKHWAFSDCGGWDVVEVMIDGRLVDYVGWQPGMLYEYRDLETGEIVWSESFPQWDH